MATYWSYDQLSEFLWQQILLIAVFIYYMPAADVSEPLNHSPTKPFPIKALRHLYSVDPRF